MPAGMAFHSARESTASNSKIVGLNILTSKIIVLIRCLLNDFLTLFKIFKDEFKERNIAISSTVPASAYKYDPIIVTKEIALKFLLTMFLL